jgi:ubiquinone/menaquinone biosynthesis C-methylase UbiE
MGNAYDRIGKSYDISRKADPEIVHRLIQHLQIRSEDKLLDVACGTGNYAVALFQWGLSMAGVDISDEMLAQARGKSGDIEWTKVDAGYLPYDDSSYQGAMCVLAIHHFRDLLAPF